MSERDQPSVDKERDPHLAANAAAYRVYCEAADQRKYVAWRDVKECIRVYVEAMSSAGIPIGELADLIRLLHQRYQDTGDTLARKAAWALEEGGVSSASTAMGAPLAEAAKAIIWYALSAVQKMNRQGYVLPNAEIEWLREIEAEMCEWLKQAGVGVGVDFSKAKRDLAALMAVTDRDVTK